jgi:predicted DNA-binding transcriptional regulator AlpA
MKSVLSTGPASGAEAVSQGPELSRRFALSEAEAAQYLGMSRAWLKKARTARFRAAIDAPQYVKAGARRVVYRRRDLEDWLQAHVRDEHPAKGRPAVPNRLPHP